MGGNVSKSVYRKTGRAVKNINIENRAQKAIEKQKTAPVVAPRHPSTVDIYKNMAEEHPGIQEELAKKDDPLIDRVNAMKLEMVDGPVQIQTNPNRPLPQNRDAIFDPLQAFMSPKKIPRGKISLSQALKIANGYENASQGFNIPGVAREYNLEETQVKQFLRYFKEFKLEEIQPPENKEAEEMNMSFSQRQENFRQREEEINKARQYSEGTEDRNERRDIFSQIKPEKGWK